MGSFKLSRPLRLLPNLRTAPAGAAAGYTWGKPARQSRILATLGDHLRTTAGGFAVRTGDDACTELDAQDAVAERWIASDDWQHPSRVAGAGQTLRELVARYPEAILGARHVRAHGPHLGAVMKLLDSHPSSRRGSLSVQVHPGSAYGDRAPKTEMWRGYGKVYLGWTRDWSEADVRRAVSHRRDPACAPGEGPLERMMNQVTLTPELPVVVPAGTVHAIRFDSFLAEWSSAPGRTDLASSTVALYDRTDGKPARPGKEQMDEALRILGAADTPGETTRFRSTPRTLFQDPAGNERRLLFRTTAVFVEDLQVTSQLTLPAAGRALPLYVERGTVVVACGGAETTLTAGDEALIPAAAGGLVLIGHGSQPARLQCWYVPDDDELARDATDAALASCPPRALAAQPSRIAAHPSPPLDESAREQLDLLRRGNVHTRLLRPCTLEDGVHALASLDVASLRERFRDAVADGRISKFVPASGAATRMFNDLLTALAELESGDPMSATSQGIVNRFSRHAREFAFSGALRALLDDGDGTTLANRVRAEPRAVLRKLLFDEGLGLARLPKALVPFHGYREGPRSPLDEHLLEGLEYTADANGVVRMHFTAAPSQLDRMRAAVEQGIRRLAPARARFEVTWSTQATSTDTVAVDEDGNPVLDADGRLHRRPAGHGALLENLQRLDADIVCIKNIDNVVPEHLRNAANRHREVLAGLLVELQAQAFEHLRALEAGGLSRAHLLAIEAFVHERLHAPRPSAERTLSDETLHEKLRERLDRPLRVCAVVPSTGEPGGGPFWVDHPDFSLQIVESGSVDLDNPEQRRVWASSTHFNPVDMVCAIRDHRGKTFDLPRYRDSSSGIVARKSLGHRPIKVLEYPGLWNGAMAYWNTVFVEVPLETFNPVKTVFNLLRASHRPIEERDPPGGD